MINPEKILEDMLKKINVIDGADIPSIDLYMDQVTTFMDRHLSGNKRFDDDKILTKTMINNYSNNNLLPPPIKKKYSREHIILLILIYYYKNILSINDINTILSPLCDMYFNQDSSVSLDEIYDISCEIQDSLKDKIKNDILDKINDSEESFSDLPKKDKNFLQLYYLITSLSFDVYIKKQMIEGIIDQINEQNEIANAREIKRAKEKKEKEKREKSLKADLDKDKKKNESN